MVTTGVRVSELTCLTRADVCTDAHGAHIACHGKGRKDRIIPVDASTTAALRAWLTHNPDLLAPRCLPPEAPAGR